MKMTMIRDRFTWSLSFMLTVIFTFSLLNLNAANAQTVEFEGTPREGYAPLTVVFTDKSTGYPAYYLRKWDFPGGSPSSAIGTQVTSTYDSPGTYNVTLTIEYNTYIEGQKTKFNYIVVLAPQLIELDWGDAPAPYPTLSADDGARHAIDPPDFFLGARVDGEMDGQPHAEAFGDDSDGSDDDDGVIFTTVLQSGNTAGVDVTASLGGGFLNAWIDFTGDGDWGDVGEQIFTDQPLTAGVNSLTFMVPTGSLGGYTIARFRLSFTKGLTFTGPAGEGEVEDHRVEVLQGPVQSLTVRIEPLQKTMGVAETCSVDAVVENVNNLGAFECTIAYNTNVVHASSAQIGTFPGSTGRTVIPVEPVIDNSSAQGSIIFAAASLGTDPGPDGSGVLATVVFTAQVEGSTNLDLQNVQLSDINGQTLTVNTLLHGQVIVSTTSNIEEAVRPDHYSLHQNYPNPFNPATTIRFSIPRSSHVRLEIYNLSGQLIETLIDEERPIGVYEILWNAETSASGLYLCRLETAGFVEMKKLILQK